jgi:acetolactate synthase-1/2/3 large subunit
LNNFFDNILSRLEDVEIEQNTRLTSHSEWVNKTQEWKSKYPVFQPEYKTNKNRINSFYFMEVLSDKLTDNNIVVTDMGTSYTCSMQSLKMNGKNRLFTSSTQASMGFGLPGAIGSHFADTNKDIILITGDGGLQMNIQELQSVIHHNIPVKIFVLNNNGYLAISLMQDNLFNGNHIGSNKKSGVSNPDFTKIAEAYGFKTFKFEDNIQLDENIDEVLKHNGPVLCEILMVENQLLLPRVQSKKDSEGNIV